MQRWAEIIGQARLSAEYLKDAEVIRTVLNILQVSLQLMHKELLFRTVEEHLL